MTASSQAPTRIDEPSWFCLCCLSRMRLYATSSSALPRFNRFQVDSLRQCAGPLYNILTDETCIYTWQGNQSLNSYEGRAVACYRAESERQPRLSSQRTLPASRLESNRLQAPRTPLGAWIGRTAKQGLFLVEILSFPAVQAMATPRPIITVVQESTPFRQSL
jgi:hypothetical protein